MRIGITCYPTYGGSGAVATELGLELGRRGHEVHMISYASPFRLRGYSERVFFHEVDVSGGNYPLFKFFPYTLALAAKQHEVALHERLDLMHVHYAIPHATTAYLAKQMLEGVRDLKVVTTLHGTDITLVGQEHSFFSITKFSIERSDAVTAVSEYLRDETYKAFGCDGCTIDVIPNFINPAEYFPATQPGQRRAIAPESTKVLVHVSNFREVKRVVDVVRIFAKVRAQVPAVLMLIGDGPGRQDAEEEARTLKVEKDVRFVGKLDSTADLLRAADLFLLPSETESFGLAALEAMACGVPVVASRVGGIPELVVHGETGALAPVGSVDTMASAALQLLCDPARGRAAREAAIRRAELFTADRVVPQYEQLYRRVLES
ncbi:MAG: N-acetyl-alpha-D-glucosaminyl L-malate synthase BshA [Gemmatimonadetes bacterium]|nr:N-acetyl-alpha-D-glucosaminyl L-malate synthase BshA [Gemmatimonadota bacterium]